MNTYNLPARPLYTLAAADAARVHAGAQLPGRAGARRARSVRRSAAARRSPATAEGWGLYTEWLGTVMGIYETPYEDFGRLTYEMWRACRLVIDTGIHQFGWTREQAMELPARPARRCPSTRSRPRSSATSRGRARPSRTSSARSRSAGIVARRRRSSVPKFDQRRFHDAILALGSVPLPVLEQRMAQFIADGGNIPPR